MVECEAFGKIIRFGREPNRHRIESTNILRSEGCNNNIQQQHTTTIYIRYLQYRVAICLSCLLFFCFLFFSIIKFVVWCLFIVLFGDYRLIYFCFFFKSCLIKQVGWDYIILFKKQQTTNQQTRNKKQSKKKPFLLIICVNNKQQTTINNDNKQPKKKPFFLIYL